MGKTLLERWKGNSQMRKIPTSITNKRHKKNQERPCQTVWSNFNCFSVTKCRERFENFSHEEGHCKPDHLRSIYRASDGEHRLSTAALGPPCKCSVIRMTSLNRPVSSLDSLTSSATWTNSSLNPHSVCLHTN